MTCSEFCSRSIKPGDPVRSNCPICKCRLSIFKTFSEASAKPVSMDELKAKQNFYIKNTPSHITDNVPLFGLATRLVI